MLVFYTYSASAKKHDNSFLQFHYGYRFRFGILNAQRKRICQSIPRQTEQRLNPTTTQLHQSPPAGESTEGPRACRSLCVPSAQDKYKFKQYNMGESKTNEKDKTEVPRQGNPCLPPMYRKKQKAKTAYPKIRCFFGRVSDGIRTHGLQGHNLTL